MYEVDIKALYHAAKALIYNVTHNYNPEFGFVQLPMYTKSSVSSFTSYSNVPWMLVVAMLATHSLAAAAQHNFFETK